VDRLYKAILPDTRANEFSRVRAVSKFLADGIAAYTERADVSGVLGRVQQLLDESIAAQEYSSPRATLRRCLILAQLTGTEYRRPFSRGGSARRPNDCGHCCPLVLLRSFALTRSGRPR
jgi:type I restriction enzyme, R subunit